MKVILKTLSDAECRVGDLEIFSVYPRLFGVIFFSYPSLPMDSQWGNVSLRNTSLVGQSPRKYIFLFFSSLSLPPLLQILKLPNSNSLLTVRCGTLYVCMYFFHYIPSQYHSSSAFICFCLLFKFEKTAHVQRLRRIHTPFGVVLKFKFS